jgi:ACR3 family arsenite transporter
MVFVWSQLTRGDPAYTLVQVSVNDVVMVFAFAPIVAFLLGVTDIPVPWETLLLSVGALCRDPARRRRDGRDRVLMQGGAASRRLRGSPTASSRSILGPAHGRAAVRLPGPVILDRPL